MQQRDMYRAMVEVSPQGTNSNITAYQSLLIWYSAMPVTVASTANQNDELRQELHAEKEEKRRLADRIQRMQVGT